jgi:hypothetical protein
LGQFPGGSGDLTTVLRGLGLLTCVALNQFTEQFELGHRNAQIVVQVTGNPSSLLFQRLLLANARQFSLVLTPEITAYPTTH